MDFCELCYSPLESNGKRNLCSGCKRVLCVSCNEMKTKLLFMTNGKECPCSLLQEIVAPEAPNKQYASFNHTGISSLPELQDLEEYTNVFDNKSSTSYGIKTDKNITDVVDGKTEVGEDEGSSEKSPERKLQDTTETKIEQTDKSTQNVDIVDQPDKSTQNVDIVDQPDKSTQNVDIIDQPDKSTQNVDIVDQPDKSTQNVDIIDQPDKSTQNVDIVDQQHHQIHDKMGSVPHNLPRVDSTSLREYEQSEELEKSTTPDNSQVKGQNGALQRLSSQEITLQTTGKDSISDKVMSPSSRPRKKASKHTCAGCGRRDCEGQFMKLMKAMNAAAKSNNFSIHNVVPDGNCMFAAIVDQLEIYGDVSFSSKSLRQACVEHLRSNPESEDGTHYEMFMDNESWIAYLDRMSLEGQWGDHLMLQAASQVTKKNIEILHGGEKQEVTKINTALAKEDQKPLHLGHVGEFHYVSLREMQGNQEQLPSDEEEEETFYSISHNDLSIIEDPKKRELFAEDYIDAYCDIPSLHMSYLLKKLLPISTVLNDADRCMHTAMTMEYSDGYQNPGSSEKSMKNETIYMYKLIGDVADGLFVDHMFWKDKDKDKEHKSVIKVPVLMIHKVITNLGNVKEDNQATHILCLERTQTTHHGFTSLVTNNLSYWGIADTKTKPVCIPKNYAFGPSNNWQEFEENKEVQKASYGLWFIAKGEIAYQCRWPEDATEWITRKRPSNWPTDAIIETIVTDGCHVIDKTHPKSLHPDSECSFCFGVAEKTICNEALTREQRYCLVIFLALCSQEFRDCKLLSTDHLKAVFFYACEELPLSCWTSNLGSCIFYLLNSLVSKIDGKNVPCYFIPGNNTIDHLSGDEIKSISDKLNNLRWNPLQHVFSLVKDREFAWEIQQVIMEDIDQFKITLNVRESVLNCFVPHAIKSARNSILRRRFKVAMDTLQNAYEDRLTVATCDDQVPFQSFFNEAVQGIPLDCQWWFLLFSDEKLGMTMSSDLSLNLEPVALGEIMDSALVKDYTSHLIPTSMALHKCQFITNFAWFLLTKYRTQQAIDNLCVCISAYREKLELESNPHCVPEVLEKYFDFNERTIYKVLVYLYYALYRQKQEDTFVYYFDIVKIVCEKLDCREAFHQAYIIASVLDKEAYNYFAQRYHTCKNSDPSITDELFLDTILPAET